MTGFDFTIINFNLVNKQKSGYFRDLEKIFLHENQRKLLKNT